MKINWFSFICLVFVTGMLGYNSTSFDPVFGTLVAGVGGFLVGVIWQRLWPVFLFERKS